MATFLVSWARLAGVEAWTTRLEAALRKLIEKFAVCVMLSTIIRPLESSRSFAVYPGGAPAVGG